MTRVSITTFTFNRPSFLTRTIESILSQTFEDFEYIIIDNGSIDDTQSILEEYKKRDRRISVVTRLKNDVSTDLFIHLQMILKARSTSYCMHVDDDDYMETTALKTLYRLITE